MLFRSRGSPIISPPFEGRQEDLYDLWLMSQSYPKYTPAEHLGVITQENPWLAWQINRAVMTFGRWVDARLEELVVRRDHSPAPKYRTTLVKKYSYRQALGLEPLQGEGEDPDIIDEARALLAGELELESWLRGEL